MKWGSGDRKQLRPLSQCNGGLRRCNLELLHRVCRHSRGTGLLHHSVASPFPGVRFQSILHNIAPKKKRTKNKRTKNKRTKNKGWSITGPLADFLAMLHVVSEVQSLTESELFATDPSNEVMLRIQCHLTLVVPVRALMLHVVDAAAQILSHL